MEPLENFISERDAALVSLDIDYGRKLFPKASSIFVILASLHKARYEVVTIDPELRHFSAKWLREHKMTRVTGEKLLPGDLLPT